MIRYLVPAAIVSLGVISSASAGPVPSAAQLRRVTETTPIQVQDRRHVEEHRRMRRNRYIAGRRYHSAPHGWHRYHRRPGDWRMRGCIIVGPVWFCP